MRLLKINNLLTFKSKALWQNQTKTLLLTASEAR
jgi:hypothetical protein